jgi:capsular polysaccharide biosynthesis protein
MDELNLKDIVKIISKRWWIILVSVLICVTASVIISYFVQVPLYQSSSTLYVGKKNVLITDQGYNDVMLGNQLVKDYRELILSRAVATRVLTDLNITYLNADQLSSKIKVSLKNDTRVIEISVTDHDNVLAKSIADDVANVFKLKVFEIMQVDNINIIDTAEVAKSPISPDKRLNVIVSFLLGLILGIGINFLIEYLDNTIKTPDDIKKYLDLPVVGVIPIIYE